MAPIVALALKDLRLLLRMRAGLFFTFVWPLLIAVGFGVILSGPSSGQSKIRVALVDEDHTPGPAAFLARLEGATELETARTTRAEAEESVRKGPRTAFIAVPQGFGAASERHVLRCPADGGARGRSVAHGRERHARRRADEVRHAGHAGGLLGSGGGPPGRREARCSRCRPTRAPDPEVGLDGGVSRRAGQVPAASPRPPVRQPAHAARIGGGGWTPLHGASRGRHRRTPGPAQHVRVHLSAGRHLGPHRLHHVVRRRASSSNARTARSCGFRRRRSPARPSSPARGWAASWRPWRCRRSCSRSPRSCSRCTCTRSARCSWPWCRPPAGSSAS